MGSISHTFPGMVYDLCEHANNAADADGSYHTLQEWIDQDMLHTHSEEYHPLYFRTAGLYSTPWAAVPKKISNLGNFI